MKNVILLGTVLFCSLISFSQTNKNPVSVKYKFGFNLGTNYSMLQSRESLPDNAVIINGIGFRFGFFMDYLLSNNFFISPKMEYSFNKSSVEFTDLENSKINYDLFPMSIELMAHFIYKTGNGKIIPYFLLGPALKIPISKNKGSTSDFKANPDIAIDFGFGLENRFKYFVFAPELRYSFGLLNVNTHPALQSLYFHNIALVLNFK